MRSPRLPEGYSEERIAAIAAHYDSQIESDAVAEDTSAWGDSRLAWVQVPLSVVPEVTELIARKAPVVEKGRGRTSSSRVAEKTSDYSTDLKGRKAAD